MKLSQNTMKERISLKMNSTKKSQGLAALELLTELEAEREKERTTGAWFNPDNKKVTKEEVFEWIKRTKGDTENVYDVIVGTDSHLHGREFRFITVVCIHKVGKGGYYYYLMSFEPRASYLNPGETKAPGKRMKGNQKLRMFNEVERSITMANNIFEETEILPMIHIDASPSDIKEFTSAFSSELLGYAESAGFQARIKPYSWASSCVADLHTK